MKPPLQQSDRAFGLMFATVLGIVAGVAYLAFDAVLIWPVAVAAAFLATALMLPAALMPLNRLWAAFAQRLGHLNNHVLLGAFFYLLVLPVGLVMRLFSDPMQRKIDTAATSYWSAVGRQADAETYRDQF